MDALCRAAPELSSTRPCSVATVCACTAAGQPSRNRRSAGMRPTRALEKPSIFSTLTQINVCTLFVVISDCVQRVAFPDAHSGAHRLVFPGSARLLPLSRTTHLLIRTGWTNLRRPHRLGHAEEDHDALASAARREGFRSARKAAIDVLPVIHHPHIPGRRDRQVSLHLQAAADATTRRRDLITCSRMSPDRSWNT